MGRELKRVPLDFDWPQNKVWEGYLNPHYEQCKPCDGIGTTIAQKRLEDLVRLILLSGSDAAENRCHPYFNEMPIHNSASKICGQEMVELTTGLAGRSPMGRLGHDSIDCWKATRTIIAAAGLSETWGTCPHCDGHGIPREKLEAYEAWQRIEPPSGDGFQIWETVSEGSPISPVLSTPEELAQWMAGKKWGADKGSSYETWLQFIVGPGWAPSLVMDSNGIRAGADAAL